MPLSDHEQRILEEIERRLAEEDPRLVEQVGRTDLYTHLARRIRLAALAFVLGFVLLLLFVVSPWVAAAGFVVMVLSALVIYRYLGQLGRDQIRAMQERGRLLADGVSSRGSQRASAAPPRRRRDRVDARVRRTSPYAARRGSSFGWFVPTRRDLERLPRSPRTGVQRAPLPRVRDRRRRFDPPRRGRAAMRGRRRDEDVEGARVRMEGFTTHQACKFTGCTPRQLRYWDQIGLVEPTVQGTGGRPGVPRLYAFRDLVALRVVKSLLDGGMSLQRVRRSWEFLNQQGRARPAPVRGQAGHRRPEHLQDLPPRRRGHGCSARRSDGVLRRDRRHRHRRRNERPAVRGGPRAVRPGAARGGGAHRHRHLRPGCSPAEYAPRYRREPGPGVPLEVLEGRPVASSTARASASCGPPAA